MTQRPLVVLVSSAVALSAVVAAWPWLPSAGGASAMTSNACIVNDAAWTTADGGCKDLATGLVWSLAAPGSVSWDYARNYGANLVEGGFDDWRMPTEAELQAAWANGAPTHLAYPGPAIWSTRTQGRWAYWVGLTSDGLSHRTLKASALTGVFVRNANAGGN